MHSADEIFGLTIFECYLAEWAQPITSYQICDWKVENVSPRDSKERWPIQIHVKNSVIPYRSQARDWQNDQANTIYQTRWNWKFMAECSMLCYQQFDKGVHRMKSSWADGQEEQRGGNKTEAEIRPPFQDIVFL